MINKKVNSIFFIVLLFFSTFSTGFMVAFPIIKIAYAEDKVSDYDNSTFIKITTPIPEPEPEPPGPGPGPPPVTTKPIINWYDFQNAKGISMLNSKIDVNKEYIFCINITSNQGWDDIEYIDIKTWFDNGDDTTTYNNSGNIGGNLNMFLRYENTTGIANYKMLWPDDEVKKGGFAERNESNPNSESSECYNLSFYFTPGYQFRYAAGDGNWDKTRNTFNDKYSWNFKISVIDRGESASGPITVTVIDEFGVNSYSEIVSVGMLAIQGRPGENASTDSSIMIKTRSNLDYSLSVDIDTFKHENHPTANISNKTMWICGGDLTKFTNYLGDNSIYLYGSVTAYNDAEDNNTTKLTNNVDYKCNIPFAQLAGNYSSKMYYKLITPISIRFSTY